MMENLEQKLLRELNAIHIRQLRTGDAITRGDMIETRPRLIKEEISALLNALSR